MQNNPPSVDPADQDSLLGMLNTCMGKFLQGVDDMLPARVVAFSRGSGGKPDRVQVQPMIHVVATSGQSIARAQIASLPVLNLGGGKIVHG